MGSARSRVTFVAPTLSLEGFGATGGVVSTDVDADTPDGKAISGALDDLTGKCAQAFKGENSSLCQQALRASSQAIGYCHATTASPGQHPRRSVIGLVAKHNEGYQWKAAGIAAQ
jgi:hypothetical protein